MLCSFFSDFSLKRCIARSVLVWLAILIGEFIPKFDLVMGIIGGTLTGPLIFILPPLFYTKMLKIEKAHRQKNSHKFKNELNDDSDTHLLLQVTTYGSSSTVQPTRNYHWLVAQSRKVLHILHSDCLLSIIIIIFGCGATLTSTYYNLFDVKNFNQFWSPCIQNISLSYKMLEF